MSEPDNPFAHLFSGMIDPPTMVMEGAKRLPPTSIGFTALGVLSIVTAQGGRDLDSHERDITGSRNVGRRAIMLATARGLSLFKRTSKSGGVHEHEGTCEEELAAKRASGDCFIPSPDETCEDTIIAYTLALAHSLNTTPLEIHNRIGQTIESIVSRGGYQKMADLIDVIVDSDVNDSDEEKERKSEAGELVDPTMWGLATGMYRDTAEGFKSQPFTIVADSDTARQVGIELTETTIEETLASIEHLLADNNDADDDGA